MPRGWFLGKRWVWREENALGCGLVFQAILPEEASAETGDRQRESELLTSLYLISGDLCDY